MLYLDTWTKWERSDKWSQDTGTQRKQNKTFMLLSQQVELLLRKITYDTLFPPTNCIHPSSIFLITLSPDLIFFSTLVFYYVVGMVPRPLEIKCFYSLLPKSFLCYSISKMSSFEFYHQWQKNLSYTSITNLLLRSIFANVFLMMLLRTLISAYLPSISIYFWLQIFTSKNTSSVFFSERLQSLNLALWPNNP